MAEKPKFWLGKTKEESKLPTGRETTKWFLRKLWETIKTPMAKEGKLSEEEREALLELSGLGGFLKPYAVGRYAGQVGKVLGSIHPERVLPLSGAKKENLINQVMNLLFVPQKELRRVIDVGLRESYPGRGTASAWTEWFGTPGKVEGMTVGVTPKIGGKGIWHEFTHVRELGKDDPVVALREFLLKKYPNIPEDVFYGTMDPMEFHANQVARKLMGKALPKRGKAFESTYETTMEEVLRLYPEWVKGEVK